MRSCHLLNGAVLYCLHRRDVFVYGGRAAFRIGRQHLDHFVYRRLGIDDCAHVDDSGGQTFDLSPTPFIRRFDVDGHAEVLASLDFVTLPAACILRGCKW